ncbi:hypothetical protein T03_5431 [Trichinella britovi]|uniref:Uncharacterized protein n=1 Tax=Trichinella britovi TaxID=45882 RepID=A0A0V1CYA2_TRIBR|nr:hypothetical protein T03_5431 [Trichinella britovi]
MINHIVYLKTLFKKSILQGRETNSIQANFTSLQKNPVEFYPFKFDKILKAHTFCRRDNDIVKQTTTSMHGEKKSKPDRVWTIQNKKNKEIPYFSFSSSSIIKHYHLLNCFNKELHEKENFQTHWPKALLVHFYNYILNITSTVFNLQH